MKPRLIQLSILTIVPHTFSSRLVGTIILVSKGLRADIKMITTSYTSITYTADWNSRSFYSWIKSRSYRTEEKVWLIRCQPWLTWGQGRESGVKLWSPAFALRARSVTSTSWSCLPPWHSQWDRSHTALLCLTTIHKKTSYMSWELSMSLKTCWADFLNEVYFRWGLTYTFNQWLDRQWPIKGKTPSKT